MQTLNYILSLDRPVYLHLSHPLIGPSLDAVGPLVIQALVVALKDSSMPKTQISFHPWTSLFLLALPILSLKVILIFLKHFCGDNKEPVLIILIHILIVHGIHLVVLFLLWP